MYNEQALFTLYGYNFPLLMTYLQMLFIAPVCYAVARPVLQWETARGVAPLALVNVLNVVSGLLGWSPQHHPVILCQGLSSPTQPPGGFHTASDDLVPVSYSVTFALVTCTGDYSLTFALVACTGKDSRHFKDLHRT